MGRGKGRGGETGVRSEEEMNCGWEGCVRGGEE